MARRYHSHVQTLSQLGREASGCTKCQLSQGRTQVVFGVGHAHADLMFVGEGPGREEDLQGEPFVGRSGKLLDTLMRQEIGIDRSHAYIANVVKCLRNDALVQLGDGTWEQIGRLVRSRYAGLVKSLDEHGDVVDRRVIGWHASPLADRKVYRLSYRSAEDASGAGEVGIHLTGDHEVLTELGWLPAEAVVPGTKIATGRGQDMAVRLMFDEAEISEVATTGSDETFFCIDVEETHNFVTAGGVVHNCRPPGNRDPLPAEIAACRPYLEGQLDLIGPKVVVTLGNFATRALLDTSEGIRRLRGKVYPFRGAHLVPTYHPAAALRGGAEVVAEMRADFVRAKRLLAVENP